MRFGSLVGPGTGFASDGMVITAVRGGKLPIVGDGSGTFSFVHTHDAATAIVAALERPEVRGALNIVDDEPLADARLAARARAAARGPEAQAGSRMAGPAGGREAGARRS